MPAGSSLQLKSKAAGSERRAPDKMQDSQTVVQFCRVLRCGPRGDDGQSSMVEPFLPYAHSIPSPPSTTNNTGSALAGINTTRRSDCTSSVGMHASNHNPVITVVADVDQGSDAASATARQSAITAKCLWSKVVSPLEAKQHTNRPYDAVSPSGW